MTTFPQSDTPATPLTEETAQRLIEVVETFTGKLEDTQRAVNRNRFWNVITGVVLLAVVFGGAYVWRLTLRVDENTNATRAAQCGFYGLILSQYDPNGPDAQDDPARYEDAFAQIRAQSDKIHCPKVVAP